MQHLEQHGYKVHRCVRTGQKRGPIWVSNSNDVFGCVDLVAKKVGERTRWVQVTADSGIGRKKADLAEVPWDQDHDCVEIWRYKGRNLFQMYLLDEDYVLSPENVVDVGPA